MAKRPLTLHIVPHIHWRRESNQTFQQSRLKLVLLLDDLLSRLAGIEDRASFLLDGQNILLSDYLEVRPDQQDVIVRLVQDGRLDIGPWYIATDPFLVSPEAIIRNLLEGRQIGARLGGWLSIGYMPDTSGHIGQMAQILRGFGITSAVVRDGLGEVPCELWWEAPDGSRVLLIYLRDGYMNAASLSVDVDALKAAIEAVRDRLGEYTATGVLLLLDGGDQQMGQADSGPLLRSITRRSRATKVLSTGLLQYIEAVLAAGDDLPVVAGELRSSQRFALRSGVLSTRLWLKQRNHTIETLLERWAEPFSAWAVLNSQQEGTSGGETVAPLHSQRDLLTHAWRVLLQNQATDSIRGCGSDQVHHEMVTRFDQAEQIGREIVIRNLHFLAGQVNTQSLPAGEPALPIVVFNAAGSPRTDLVSLEIASPTDIQSLEVIDETGALQPFEVLTASTQPDQDGEPAQTVIIRFVAQDVPSFGYRTYALRPGSSPSETCQPISDNSLSIENEFLSVSVMPEEGTLSLFDKRTGRSFSGLNRYVDGGDRGDTFTYCPPQRDTLIEVATNTPLHVERHTGAVTQTLELFQIFRLPESLTPERNARLPLAAQFVPISIATTITVTRGVPRVDVVATISNNARDHRLRVHFPTGVVAQEALFDGHFEVVRRDVALPAAEDTIGWAEQPAPEKPQRAFTTVLGSETGLTIANRGLPEAAVLMTPQGLEIALTLLRCIGWISRDDLPNRRGHAGPPVAVPGAQCQGEYTCAYSIIPHGADPLPAWQEAWAFQTPLWGQITRLQHGSLPLTASFISVDNPVFVLSAVKMAADGDGIIVRGYNLSQSSEQVTLRSGLPFSRAQCVWLDESSMGVELPVSDRRNVTFEAGPAEIVTIRLSGYHS